MRKKLLCYTLVGCLIICVSTSQTAYAADWAAEIAAGAGAAVGGSGGTVLMLAGLLLGVAITGDYLANHQDDINAAINTAVNTAAKGVDNAAEKAQEFWDRVSTGVVDTTSYVWQAVCDVVADLREVIESSPSDSEPMLVDGFLQVPYYYPVYIDGYSAEVYSKAGSHAYVCAAQSGSSYNVYFWILSNDTVYGREIMSYGTLSWKIGTAMAYKDDIVVQGFGMGRVSTVGSSTFNPDIPIYESESSVKSAIIDLVKNGVATDVPDIPGQTYGNLDDVIDAYPDAGVGVIGRDGVISIPDVTTVLGVEALEDIVAGVIADAIDYPMVIEAADAIPYVYPLDGIPLAIDPAAENADQAVTDIEVALPSGSGTADTDMRVYGLDEIFPFCIPFDLYALFGVLAADPEAPVISWDLKVMGKSFNVTIDLSPFDDVARLLRNLEILVFCIGLAFETRNLIRG